MANVLIVEDEAIVAMATKLMLTNLKHHTIGVVATGEQATMVSCENPVDLILMDIKLKGEIDGIKAALEIRKQKATPILFITGNSDSKTKSRIEEVSNATVLQKPVLIEDLKISIEQLLS